MACNLFFEALALLLESGFDHALHVRSTDFGLGVDLACQSNQQ